MTTVRYKYGKGKYSGYCVGDDGSFWSQRKWKNWHKITPKPNKDGYLRVHLAFGLRFIHVLVLRAFIGKCPKGMECRHLNGDPADNRLSNICWGTPKDNWSDQRKHGRRPDQSGENNPFAKANCEMVKEIRRLYDTGLYSQQKLGDTFGLNQAHVSRIIRSVVWKTA